LFGLEAVFEQRMKGSECVAAHCIGDGLPVRLELLDRAGCRLIKAHAAISIQQA